MPNPAPKQTGTKGPTFLEALDQFPTPQLDDDAPLRFCVQDVYKFDERRIIAGRVESGTISQGDEVIIWPYERKVKISSIERWNVDNGPQTATPGESVGLMLDHQAFIERGNTISHVEDPSSLTTWFDANIFWMGNEPLKVNTPLQIKLLTQEIECRVTRVHQIINTESLREDDETHTRVGRNQVAVVTVRTIRPIALDAFQTVKESGRFVMVEDGTVCGGGIVSSTHSSYSQVEELTSKDISWSFSEVNREQRHSRNGHRGATIWLTGLSGSGKSTIARALEVELFRRGGQTYILDGDNIRHGLNADLGFSAEARTENIRRIGEVAKLFADSGQIVITSFISPFRKDRDRVRRIFDSGSFFEVHIKCPLEVCEERDPKGLYKKAREGLIKEFTGIDSPFEEPEKPEIVLNTDKTALEDCVDQILTLLNETGVFTV